MIKEWKRLYQLMVKESSAAMVCPACVAAAVASNAPVLLGLAVGASAAIGRLTQEQISRSRPGATFDKSQCRTRARPISK